MACPRGWPPSGEMKEATPAEGALLSAGVASFAWLGCSLPSEGDGAAAVGLLGNGDARGVAGQQFLD